MLRNDIRQHADVSRLILIDKTPLSCLLSVMLDLGLEAQVLAPYGLVNITSHLSL